MMKGLWDRETTALIMLAAYMPLAVFWLRYGGAQALAGLGLVVLCLAIWNLVFMLARAQAPSFAALITALAIAMLAPVDLGAFRLVLGGSFGVALAVLAATVVRKAMYWSALRRIMGLRSDVFAPEPQLARA